MNNTLPMKVLCSAFNQHTRTIVSSSWLLSKYRHARKISTVGYSVTATDSKGKEVFVTLGGLKLKIKKILDLL